MSGFALIMFQESEGVDRDRTSTQCVKVHNEEFSEMGKGPDAPRSQVVLPSVSLPDQGLHKVLAIDMVSMMSPDIHKLGV